ncbi:MAG: carboxypeptidase regulatory-like domain-containing protein [Acidobacteriota bacterium]
MHFHKRNDLREALQQSQIPKRWSSPAAWVLFGLIALLCLVPGAQAQITSGSILGSVQDATGAFVPHATITATDMNIGVVRTTTSSEAGTFALPNLPPGNYTLEVTAQGFQTFRKSGLILMAGSSLNAGDLALQVGSATATVEVAANTGQMQIQSDSGDRSDVITSKQLKDVAMNGRNVLDYLRLIPGVSGVGAFAASGTGGLSSYSINGTRQNSHEFTLDGSSNVDTGDNGGTQVTMNVDSIAEVKVLTSNYAAEFGKASGGQIAVTSKGGTNDLHGSVHFFHRNDGMNATGWYNNHNDIPKLLYRYNTEGYDVGGPIKRDKLFFFWSNEFYQQLVPAGTNSYYVPTTAERQGNFSQSYDSSGQPITIYQPGTTTPYSGNTIPSGSIDTSMQSIMNLYAQPNVSSYGTTQFLYNRIDNVSFNDPRKEFIARVDYQINPNERFFVRWTGNRESTITPMQTGILQCMGTLQIVGGCVETQPGWNLAADLTSTIRANLLNELTVGPSVYRTTWTSNNGNLSVGKNNVNLPLLYAVTSDTSIPDISYSGNGQNYPWSYYGANPWFQANTTINVNDNLTWIKRSHSFKFGIFYQRSRKDQPAWGNYNGQFNFNNCATSNNVRACDPATGSPFASALLGYFSSFDQSSARPRGYFRYNQLEFYAQDTWQVMPRLTLDYGMRFVWIPPQFDAKNQIALFDPSAYVRSAGVQIDTNGNPIPNSGNPLTGMRFASNGTLPQGGWNSRGIMVEPRVGFAWDPIGDHKGVLRGGFGMSHDREQGNLVFNPTFTNPMNVTTPSITAPTYLPLSAIQSAPQNAPGVLSGIIGADRAGQVPTVYSFSLGIQRDLGSGFALDVAYVGTMSRHLVTARDINTIPYGTTFTKAAQNPANFQGGVVPDVEPNLPPEYAAAGYSFSGQYAYPDNYLAPFWGYDQLEYYKFDGTSNYNGLQASLQRRFGHRLTAGAVYTWSKSMTTSTADESYVDPFNPRKYNYQVAGWDRTHVAAINYVYDLPAVARFLGGSRVLGMITDGYQLSGVSNFMTGTPTWTPFWVQGSQLTGGRQWSKIPPAYLGIDSTGKPILPKIGQPYKGTPEKLRDGGMQTWDMSLFKNFPLGQAERAVLQIRCETYNVFNHPNFASHDLGANLTLPSYSGGTYTPESVSLDSSWNQPTSMWSQAGPGGPRVIQLGARIDF